MYCPKCKQSFEEGSRRFCPTDGFRLVSERGEAAAKGGGIFANLIPKIDAIKDLEEPRPNPPSPAPAGRSNAEPSDTDDVFFELDDLQLEMPGAAREPEAAPADQRPTGRKVNPFDIPAGHVDLADSTRAPVFDTDFDDGDPEDFVGRTVKGRYSVIEFLGGDENGLAYLAEDRLVEDKKVLVRIIYGDRTDEILDSILSEERVSLSHFSHPNIARLIDSGEFTGGPNFLVTEYVDSLSVADILNIHGHIEPARAGRIIRQASNALNEAHQEGILHRDIRPENLIIEVAEDGTEQTKLVNFGASTGEPNPHNVAYKAHDVLDGRAATAASDIHSLAVVAFQMVTGALPFRGESAREIAKAQSSRLAVKPSEIRPGLPAALDAVFAKAFSFNAMERYPKARDLGDAFSGAVAGFKAAPVTPPLPMAVPSPVISSETLKPLVPAPVPVADPAPKMTPPPAEPPAAKPEPDLPAWMNRSPEPPVAADSRSRLFWILGIIGLLAIVGAAWYYIVNNPAQPDVAPVAQNTVPQPVPAQAETISPPLPRNLPQPPNTSFYQNSKQNLKGDLLRNFVGFTMYYPKDWKVNGPQESTGSNTRGKFLDISGNTADGKLKEQMLISYYPSRGTYTDDAGKFPELVKETNDTLKGLLPGYQMVSEGEIRFNGEWRAYEIKFQAVGKSPTGEDLTVWGRRLYIPAARPGVRNGFEITMLATSHAEGVRGVNDVGVKGELAPVLYSFEPSQNF
jgi:serine/threonine-protein kinase